MESTYKIFIASNRYYVQTLFENERHVECEKREKHEMFSFSIFWLFFFLFYRSTCTLLTYVCCLNFFLFSSSALVSLETFFSLGVGGGGAFILVSVTIFVLFQCVVITAQLILIRNAYLWTCVLCYSSAQHFEMWNISEHLLSRFV